MQGISTSNILVIHIHMELKENLNSLQPRKRWKCSTFVLPYWQARPRKIRSIPRRRATVHSRKKHTFDQRCASKPVRSPCQRWVLPLLMNRLPQIIPPCPKESHIRHRQEQKRCPGPFPYSLSSVPEILTSSAMLVESLG